MSRQMDRRSNSCIHRSFSWLCDALGQCVGGRPDDSNDIYHDGDFNEPNILPVLSEDYRNPDEPLLPNYIFIDNAVPKTLRRKVTVPKLRELRTFTKAFTCGFKNVNDMDNSQSLLMSIPLTARAKIYGYLPKSKYPDLRIVCRQMKLEIEEFYLLPGILLNNHRLKSLKKMPKKDETFGVLYLKIAELTQPLSLNILYKLPIPRSVLVIKGALSYGNYQLILDCWPELREIELNCETLSNPHMNFMEFPRNLSKLSLKLDLADTHTFDRPHDYLHPNLRQIFSNGFAGLNSFQFEMFSVRYIQRSLEFMLTVLPFIGRISSSLTELKLTVHTGFEKLPSFRPEAQYSLNDNSLDYEAVLATMNLHQFELRIYYLGVSPVGVRMFNFLKSIPINQTNLLHLTLETKDGVSIEDLKTILNKNSRLTYLDVVISTYAFPHLLDFTRIFGNTRLKSLRILEKKSHFYLDDEPELSDEKISETLENLSLVGVGISIPNLSRLMTYLHRLSQVIIDNWEVLGDPTLSVLEEPNYILQSLNTNPGLQLLMMSFAQVIRSQPRGNFFGIIVDYNLGACEYRKILRRINNFPSIFHVLYQNRSETLEELLKKLPFQPYLFRKHVL